MAPILKEERKNTEQLLTLCCSTGIGSIAQSGKILLYSLCSFLGLLPNQSPNQVTDVALPHRLEHAHILSQIIISSNMMPLNVQQDRWLRALVPLVEDPGLIPRTHMWFTIICNSSSGGFDALF